VGISRLDRSLRKRMISVHVAMGPKKVCHKVCHILDDDISNISEKKVNPVQTCVKTDHISYISRENNLHTVEVTGSNPVSPILILILQIDRWPY
jgi:hypothetical protein